MNASNQTIEVEKQIKDELHILLEEEELKWRQCAKETWLKNDDQNTKFFHASANQRNRRNLISQIVDGYEVLCSTHKEIEHGFIHYYQDLFNSSRPQNMELCTQAIQSLVTAPMNQ
jgi:effector-binding domain-containing protein